MAEGTLPAGELDFSPGNYEAIHHVCEVASQVTEKWGIKRVIGATWAFLHLCPEPACAKDICKALGISPALVSITIQELLKHELVSKHPTANRRRDYFGTEMNLIDLLHRMATKAPNPSKKIDAHKLNLALEILDGEAGFRPDLKSRRTCQFQKVRTEDLRKTIVTLSGPLN